MGRRRYPALAANRILVAGASSILLLSAQGSASALDFFALFEREPARSLPVEAPTHIQKTPPAKPAREARRPAQKAATAGLKAAERASAARAPKAEAEARRDAPLFGVVSIADQRISIYDNNGLVTRSPVSTGMAGHSTPRGIFTIIGRERYHESNIYSGAPMPFMQRITWSGIAMHVGVVPGHPASHGCVRLPADFAQKLWGMTRIGERLVISPEDVAPVSFAHPALPEPRMRLAAPAGQAPVYGPTESGEETPPPARVDPRQFAERLKAGATADAQAAAKAAKAAQAAETAARDEAEAARRDLAAAEAAGAAAQSRADAADEAYLAATARAHALQEQASLGAATDESPRRDRFGTAMEAAVKARAAAAAAKIEFATAAVEARKRQAAARSALDATQQRLAEASNGLGRAKAAAEAASKAEAEARRRLAPVSVLFSRKDQRVYVRQGLVPLFDAPIGVRDAEKPLGAHLFIATAVGGDGSALQWTALTMPGSPAGAAEALERIEMTEEVRARIGERLWTGGSIIVADQPPSGETGADGTDLTIKLR